MGTSLGTRIPLSKMHTNQRPPRSAVAHHWRLDPDLVFLNHGSFGACPTPVVEAQQQMRDRIEREPVSFFCDELFHQTDRSRKAIASLTGGRPEDYVFLANATQSVATVLDNALMGVGLPGGKPLGPGDEILINSHEYPACQNIIRRAAARAGAKVVTAELPWLDEPTPVTADRLFEIMMSGVTDRTRFCMMSLITSPTGMIMPVSRLVHALRARGVATLVDAAHGPGAIEMDVTKLGADFITSNCHKWLCSPKGSAFLYVRPEHQQGFRPMALSNYANAPEGTKNRSKFNLEFDYVGTDDPTARLAIADAVERVPECAERSWSEIIAHNRDLVMRGRDVLLERLGMTAPASDELIGPLAVVPLPDTPPERRKAIADRPTLYSNALQDKLVTNHGVQVPVWVPSAYLGQPFDGKRYIRLSAQVYNTLAQYEYLADALLQELEAESRL